MTDHSTPQPSQVLTALEGADPTRGIVAVEPSGPARVAVYRRLPNQVTERSDTPFRPWLLSARPEPWSAIRPAPEITRLEGDHPLRYLITFSSWNAGQDAVRAGRESRETFLDINSFVDQYLFTTGRTLFKGMIFEDVRRLQLDIETTGLDPLEADNRIVIATVRGPAGEERVLNAKSEEAILSDLNNAIAEFDPDVIEGHNIYNFDLPFIAQRANRWGVTLPWGRDGSAIRFGQRPQRFRSGALSHPFKSAFIHGRHIIDTYQQIQRYDIAGNLTSYGLKPAVEALGLTRENREFVPGPEIRDVWASDPDRLIRYALDDVRDVDLLSRLATPTEFYQTQVLPRSFQHVAVMGPGTKVNDLMLRAYLDARHSVPLPSESRDYPGGHTELLEVGVFRPVVKCDVESLYPSLMLNEQITSRRDTLGVFLPMLNELTNRRLHAKAQVRLTAGHERATWDGLQSSFKVLINSFYGYLGFGGGLFNDYEAAGRVTIAGHRVIQQTVSALRETGAIPIEVDTDGVYFVPPSGVNGESAEFTYINEIGSRLPSGIRLAHDGSYEAMLSLQIKNYALLDHNDKLTLKGSSLRSRRLEPCFRDFIIIAVRAFMSGDRDCARERYFELAEQIRAKTLPVESISQWAMVRDDTLNAQARLKRLIDRLPTRIRGGERIQMYEREDGELAAADEYASDENVGYLLRRLHDTAKRFEVLFTSPSEFAAFFPPITSRTDIDSARTQETTSQLSLF